MNERLAKQLAYIRANPCPTLPVRRNPKRTERERITGYLWTRLRFALFRAQSDVKTPFGCSALELRRHFEDQFSKGMSWENYGRWEIDHVCQRRRYDAAGMVACFHYTNLRPYPARLNRLEGFVRWTTR